MRGLRGLRGLRGHKGRKNMECFHFWNMHRDAMLFEWILFRKGSFNNSIRFPKWMARVTRSETSRNNWCSVQPAEMSVPMSHCVAPDWGACGWTWTGGLQGSWVGRFLGVRWKDMKRFLVKFWNEVRSELFDVWQTRIGFCVFYFYIFWSNRVNVDAGSIINIAGHAW